MKNICKGLPALFLLMAFFFQEAAAGTLQVNMVTQLDASKQITAPSNDYYLDLPDNWQKYITVEREHLPEGNFEHDKLNFYFRPVDTTINRVFLMNLFIYKKENWYESLNYKKVFESDNYIFALYAAKSNPLTGTVDKILFNGFMREAADIYFVKDFLSFPGDESTQMQLNITVDGVTVPTKAIQLNRNTVLLPIRDVCDKLGYDVGWLSEQSLVTISNGSFYTAVSLDKRYNTQYETLNQNGTVYVTSIFFHERLKCSIEIDENSNVVLTNKKSY